MSMKNSNDNIENRSRDLLACSTVPQQPAPRLRQVVMYTQLILCSVLFRPQKLEFGASRDEISVVKCR